MVVAQSGMIFMPERIIHKLQARSLVRVQVAVTTASRGPLSLPRQSPRGICRDHLRNRTELAQAVQCTICCV